MTARAILTMRHGVVAAHWPHKPRTRVQFSVAQLNFPDKVVD